MGRALRQAALDFYFHSIPLVVANMVVGAVLGGILLAALAIPPAALLVVAAVLPVAGLMRMATRLHRDLHVDLRDGLEVLHRPMPVLALGAIQLGITAVAGVDVLVALAWGSWFGTLLLVVAGYTLLATWIVAVVAWPIRLDPARDGASLRIVLRLAVSVIALSPIRVLGLAGVLGAGLALAAVLILPIATFALGIAFLAAARFALPAADRVEGRRPPVGETRE